MYVFWMIGIQKLNINFQPAACLVLLSGAAFGIWPDYLVKYLKSQKGSFVTCLPYSNLFGLIAIRFPEYAVRSLRKERENLFWKSKRTGALGYCYLFPGRLGTLQSMMGCMVWDPLLGCFQWSAEHVDSSLHACAAFIWLGFKWLKLGCQISAGQFECLPLRCHPALPSSLYNI